jgi:sortase A
MLYRYLKAQPAGSEEVSSLNEEPKDSKALFKFSLLNRVIPIFFIFLGLCLLFLVFYPFLSYKLDLIRWDQQVIISPIPEMALAESKGFAVPVETQINSEGIDKPEVINETDYNLISNWFPSKTMPKVENNKITHYSLSISKLKIEDAVVTIGGKELGSSLIQYPGTALPGEYGNTVIFGHSVLPTFYNPKDYKTIFSLLPTLAKGEKIILEFDGMKFTYIVEEYFEAKPEDVDILEQRFDRQSLSLITCVPPGTYLRRGIIKAKLEKI